MIFADVLLNQFKTIMRSTGSILSYESKNTIELYYVNKGPVIFRAIIKKDNQDKFRLFMLQVPSNRIVLRARLGEVPIPEIAELKKQVEKMDKNQLSRIA